MRGKSLKKILFIFLITVFSILFSSMHKELKIETGSGTILASAKKESPWITVAPNKRYFAFEDGRSFFPIGTAMAGEQAQVDYFGRVHYEFKEKFPGSIDVAMDPDSLEKFFQEKKSNGENVLRVATDGWTFSRNSGFVQYLIDSGKVRFFENPVGFFDNEYAKRIDRLMSLAQKYDIYIDFSISPDTLQWGHFIDKHPYHKKNGGPIDKVGDIFISRQAKDAYKNRIKYMIDRWGNSPNIFAWEIFNEINWWGGEGHAKEKKQFVTEMAYFIKNHEKEKFGKNHLVIVSSSNYNDQNDYIFNANGIDAAVTHYYFSDSKMPDPYLNSKQIKKWTVDNLKNRVAYNKPFWENERLSGRCEIFKDNEMAISMAEIANGAAGSGLPWVHSEQYLPESMTKFDLNGEHFRGFLPGYFQKNSPCMRYDLVKGANKITSKVTTAIDWANFNSKSINQDITTERSDIEPMAISDGLTVFGFLVKNNGDDPIIDYFRNVMNFPEGCDGSLVAGKTALNDFIKYYSKNGIRISKKELLNNVINLASRKLNIDKYEAKKWLEEHVANSKSFQKYIAMLPPQIKYELNVILAAQMKAWESRYGILAKNYKNYPKASTYVNIKNLNNEKHNIFWYDLETGEIISKETVSGSSLRIATPEFRKFMVFIIKPSR